MTRFDRTCVWLTRILIAGMVGYGLGHAVAGNLKYARYIIAGALIVILVTYFARHMFGLIPSWLVLFMATFMVLGSCFGFGYGMYGKWWPWDDLMHAISGVVFGFFGVVLVEHMCNEWAPRPPVWARVMIAMLFACFIALMWELYEFGSDLYFGTFFQQNDLYDTMIDLFYGALWGLITASGYYFVKKRFPHLVKELSRK